VTSYPHRLFKYVFELIFPYRCVGCGVYLENTYLCDDCTAKIPLKIRLECIGCRRSSPGGITCPDCRSEWSINRIFIVSDYHDPIVASTIKTLKYKFLPEAAAPLVSLAARFIHNQSALHRIAFAGENFLIMPVPLHKRRENWRGFNQAALLGQGVASRFHLEYGENLVRTVHLMPQVSISDRDLRMEHVRRVYSCYDSGTIRSRNILLVDDVCTTGATLNECARVLKQAGAVSVTALVIARG